MEDPQEQIAALEAALAKTQAALQAEREARQAFVSLVTHELRIPMTSIKGYTDLLLKQIMGPINDQQASFLGTIRANVERMSHMVADLSDINKIDGERLKLTFESIAVTPLVEEVLASFQSTITEKSLTVQTDLPAALPPVWGDRDRYEQVLHKLLQNAVQYTPSGGSILVTAQAETASPNYVRITIRDTGIGIPDAEQDRIGEMFFRASDEKTRETPGNGLSLHLSQKLIDLQKGELGFESERDRGSTFFVLLPVAADSAAT